MKITAKPQNFFGEERKNKKDIDDSIDTVKLFKLMADNFLPHRRTKL